MWNTHTKKYIHSYTYTSHTPTISLSLPLYLSLFLYIYIYVYTHIQMEKEPLIPSDQIRLKQSRAQQIYECIRIRIRIYVVVCDAIMLRNGRMSRLWCHNTSKWCTLTTSCKTDRRCHAKDYRHFTVTSPKGHDIEALVNKCTYIFKYSMYLIKQFASIRILSIRIMNIFMIFVISPLSEAKSR